MNPKAFNPQLFQATEEGLVHSKKERERRQNPGPLNQPKLNPGKAFQDKLGGGAMNTGSCQPTGSPVRFQGADHLEGPSLSAHLDPVAEMATLKQHTIPAMAL